MKPKEKYMSHLGTSVTGHHNLNQHHVHLNHHHHVTPHDLHLQQRNRQDRKSHHVYHQSSSEEEDGCQPMDLRVRKVNREPSSSSSSVNQMQSQSPSSLESVYGELAARYMLLNAEMREKQLSSLLPLLLLRPFAAASATVSDNNCLVSKDSPDGSETELRLADTTEILDDRKRVTRPLTGRYVRHGTGASPATLLTLRNMIQQRQRQRQHHVQPNNKKIVKRKTRKRK